MNASSMTWLCALAATACTAPSPVEPEPVAAPVIRVPAELARALIDLVPTAPVPAHVHVAPDEPALPIEWAETPRARDGWHVTDWARGVSLPIYGAIIGPPRRTR